LLTNEDSYLNLIYFSNLNVVSYCDPLNVNTNRLTNQVLAPEELNIGNSRWNLVWKRQKVTVLARFLFFSQKSW